MTACKSYIQNGPWCRDGFIQTPMCSGDVGCFQCGHVSDRSAAHCMKDELPSHFVDGDGKPRFYRLQEMKS